MCSMIGPYLVLVRSIVEGKTQSRCVDTTSMICISFIYFCVFRAKHFPRRSTAVPYMIALHHSIEGRGVEASSGCGHASTSFLFEAPTKYPRNGKDLDLLVYSGS